MARVSIDTSTKSTATAYSFQRKLWKTTADKLILFANVSNILKYKTSDDNGENWSVWTTVFTSPYSLYSFDTFMDGSNNIYIAIQDFDNFTFRIYFKKLTYSAGTWSIGSTITVSTSSTAAPSITVRSNGNVWISRPYSGGGTVVYQVSTDDGATWGANQTISLASAEATALIPKDTKIWLFVQAAAKLKVYEYDVGMDAGTDIAASGITNNITSLGILKVSDSEIYVTGRTSSGIKIYKYTGSWDGGTLLSDNANDNSPTISSINSKAVVIWSDYDGANYDIVYRKWNGSSWDVQVALIDDADGNNYPSTNTIDTDYLYVEYTTGVGSPYTIYFDKVNLNPTHQKIILSDAKIKVFDEQKMITSDALITSIVQKTILSDSKIKAEDIQQNILSDAKLIDLYQKTILSDTKIKALAIQKTILSNAKICIQVLVDVINKVNFVKQILSDINNKVNTVILVLSDINNFINTCKAIVSDVANDFRTKKLSLLNDIANDVRFMYSWQKATDNTLQSLGKEYIKIYIGGIEQIDVDVDSISISKDLSTAHTATFDLGRAYDAAKPTMEATVSIRYYDNSYINYWTLFSGYITSITPADSPEKMRINCQDEYWKQNKTNVYYHVGHTPTDDKELYYDTLAEALNTQHGWSPGIGNFVPQTLDNFAVGKSDAITNLIRECGNYEWFYDVDGSKKLWTAGEGSIIKLERQTLGENINLYDVINHSFEESVEDIVNKFRVQIGDKVIRKFNSTGGNRTYTGYNYSSYHQYVTPAWDATYERLAKNSGTGEGWDWHRPENANLYRDVFKKYNMPYLDPKLSSWSDRYPPYVEIYETSWLIFNAPIAILKEGFTIDYENQTITFNDPIYLYQTDANGEISAIRAPLVRVFLWKKNYYTYTLDPTDDPETDISNPLMFFTAKMGNYSDTIIKDLNLSNLSIQEGGRRILPDGTEEYIPSWDDTDFAYDIANWELSKVCDKKIRGTIIITLDAMCYYNIDLGKQIYIDGITDEAMNITGITYNLSNFTVTLTLENRRYYNRTVSFASHGE